MGSPMARCLGHSFPLCISRTFRSFLQAGASLSKVIWVLHPGGFRRGLPCCRGSHYPLDSTQQIPRNLPCRGFPSVCNQRYAESKNNMLALDASSKLSPWLANGSLSPRRVFEALRRREAEISADAATWHGRTNLDVSRTTFCVGSQIFPLGFSPLNPFRHAHFFCSFRLSRFPSFSLETSKQRTLCIRFGGGGVQPGRGIGSPLPCWCEISFTSWRRNRAGASSWKVGSLGRGGGLEQKKDTNQRLFVLKEHCMLKDRANQASKESNNKPGFLYLFFCGGACLRGTQVLRHRLAWKGGDREFQLWQQGQTGFPLVDANMREMATTGWMSNRGRQSLGC